MVRLRVYRTTVSRLTKQIGGRRKGFRRGELSIVRRGARSLFSDYAAGAHRFIETLSRINFLLRFQYFICRRTIVISSCAPHSPDDAAATSDMIELFFSNAVDPTTMLSAHTTALRSQSFIVRTHLYHGNFSSESARAGGISKIIIATPLLPSNEMSEFAIRSLNTTDNL